MTSKAERLGRGASFGSTERVSARRAAIAAATGAPTQGVEPRHLPLKLISLNPDNPREELRNIQEMADTFQSIGQITAITIGSREAYLKGRPDRAGDLEPGTEYVIVDGNRRLSAARLLGWETMPKIVIDDTLITTDEQLLEAAFIANTQREDMTDLEEAEALRKLVTYYGSQRQAAKRLGMSQAVISQRLSLLSLSPDLQAELNSGARKVEHVRGLSGLAPEEQRAKADERAAAAKAGAGRRRQAAPTGSPGAPAAPRRGAEGDNGVITAAQPDAPTPTGAVPAQPTPHAAETRNTESPGREPSWPEPDWAVGDVTAPVNAARDLVNRFTHEQRRVIVSYLLSVGDAEEPEERAMRTAE